MSVTVFKNLDTHMVDCGLAASRTRAQDMIADGKVKVNGVLATSGAWPVTPDMKIELVGHDHPWVSRDGIKLDAAIDFYRVHVAGRAAVDIGAGTGAFTDVLLARGAAQVYAIDNTPGQLHDRIKADGRVIVMDQHDVKTLTARSFVTPFDLVVCDVSLMPIVEALEPINAIAGYGTEMIALIKPQFEVGPEKLDRRGVVKDAAVVEKACADVCAWMNARGWVTKKLFESPILSSTGNREFFVFGYKGKN